MTTVARRTVVPLWPGSQALGSRHARTPAATWAGDDVDAADEEARELG
jgi:hypothetical protein